MKSFISIVSILAVGLWAWAQSPDQTPVSTQEEGTPVVMAAPTEKLPTQTDIVRFGSKKYFPNLKKNLADNLLTLMKLNDYPKFQKAFEKDATNSPFNLLQANSHRNFPAQEWSLPFYNSASDMADVLEVEFGLCAGFSVTVRKLNMMAFYDPSNTEKQKIPEYGTPEWAQFYNAKIDAMMENKMTVIPGFTNLYEMASVPVIQKHIKEVIVRQWELVNVNFVQGTLGGMMAVKKKTEMKELKALHAKLSQRVSYGYNPIVYLSKYNDKFLNGQGWKEAFKGEYADFKKSMEDRKKNKEKTKAELSKIFSNLKSKWNEDMTDQWIHVLQIYEVSPIEKDGSFYLKAWDINEEAEQAPKRITVSAAGKIVMNMDFTLEGEMIHFAGRTMKANPELIKALKENGSELNAIIPLKWDDLDVEHMIESNIEFCKTHNCTKKM